MNECAESIQLFHPSDSNKPLHYISDLAYWQKLFHKEAEINQKHKRDVTKLIQDNVAAMKKSATPPGESAGENVTKFMDSMRAFVGRLTEQKKEYSKSTKLFLQMEDTLVKYKDKWRNHMVAYDTQLKYLHKKLENSSKLLEKCHKQYYKQRFIAEKQALKVKLALKADIAKKANKRGERASAAAHCTYTHYEAGVQRWNKMATDARSISEEYENAYVERELERTELVMAALEKMEIPRDRKTNRNLKFGDFTFSGMDMRDMIEHLATGEEFMRTIKCPQVQDYDASKNLVAMYEDAKRELSLEEAGQTDHSHDDSDIDTCISLDSGSEDDVDNSLPDSELSKILAKYRKCKYFVVTTGYTKQNLTEISLKLGERVKQLLPANAKGMAYGEVRHGLLNKKKKGFYPVDNTKLLTTLNADDDKANERKKKLAKKYQKKIKKAKTKDKTSETCAKGPIETATIELRNETHVRNVADGSKSVEYASGSNGKSSNRDRYV